jgi:hypothetical protein
MMADYRLTHNDIVVRTVDEVYIPNDLENRDRIVYEKWLADGGVPDPYVPEEVPPNEPSPEMLALENRIRALEALLQGTKS